MPGRLRGCSNMLIKNADLEGSYISPFFLIGKNENALSKSLAYCLANDRRLYFEFLKLLNLNKRNTKKHFNSVSIDVQKKDESGVTDIEIKKENDYYIIIESKVKKGKITKQREQYVTKLKKSRSNNKIMVFLTEEKDFKFTRGKSVHIFYLDWIDIYNLLNSKLQLSTYSKELSKFMGGFKMTQKEILIQNVGDEAEVKRFINFHVYRRGKTYGRPLYFAPYFTRRRKNKEGEGVIFISRILAVLTIKPKEYSLIRDELLKSLENYEEYKKEKVKKENMVERWIEGVKTDSAKNKEKTYYFLDDPIKLNKPLMKAKSAKDSIGWIRQSIPPNRRVTFAKFIERMCIN